MSPTDIINALLTYNTRSTIYSPREQLDLIYAQLPGCKQRYIATLQCAMIEPQWRYLVPDWKAQHQIDLANEFNQAIKTKLTS